MNWTDCKDDGCQIHLSEKEGSGWYPQFTRRSRKPSVAHDHTGDRRWKETQGRTGPHNNLAAEEPEGRIMKSRAGSTVSTTGATNTDGKRWTPAIIPDKWERKGNCQRMTGGNTKNEKP